MSLCETQWPIDLRGYKVHIPKKCLPYTGVMGKHFRSQFFHFVIQSFKNTSKGLAVILMEVRWQGKTNEPSLKLKSLKDSPGKLKEKGYRLAS